MQKRTSYILAFLIIFSLLWYIVLWSDSSFSQVDSDRNEDTGDRHRYLMKVLQILSNCCGCDAILKGCVQ
jgi:hypothetical protein